MNGYPESSVTQNRNETRLGNFNTQRINQTSVNLNVSVDLTGDGHKAICRKDNLNVEVYNGSTVTFATASSQAMLSEVQYGLRRGTTYSTMGLEYYWQGAYLTEDEVNLLHEEWDKYVTNSGL